MEPIKDFTGTKRHLPHFQLPGSVYFITFTTKDRIQIAKESMKELFDIILFNNNIKYVLFAFVILFDHVHIILQPMRKNSGYFSISEIMHSIKSYSSSRINELENQKGRTLWLSESYDRIIRNEIDFWEKVNYIIKNNSEEPESLLYLVWDNQF